MNNYNMFIPTRTLFGCGELNNLYIQPMPGKKALLLISNGKSTKANGYLARTEEQLEKAGAVWALFDKIEANPLKSTVTDGGKFARENDCDFIVALGGGSVMDAAKAIASLATNNRDLWDYVSGGTGKGMPLENAPLPIIAITTTAGTGSEVDAWGVITNEETNEKIGYGDDDRLFPVLAVVDPELTLSVPPAFTAYQGFDALFHSTETYINNAANAFSDMVALTAIKHIAEYLPKAVANGNDLEARSHVSFGNTISGYSMVAGGCTSEHSLEHAMSAYHQALPHGAGLIMISMAYYKRFIEGHACDDRFIEMARVMGLKNADKAEDFAVALENLLKACCVDNLKMSDYGIRPYEFKTLAENALTAMGGLFERDRVKLGVDDCVGIYADSYK